MRVLLIAGAAAALAACAKEQVLFVCEHGAAKSVVAAAYFNKLASERGLRARAVARGAAPQDALAKSALAGLQGDGLAPGLEAPQAVTEADVHGSARVVSFDCDQPPMKPLLAAGDCWSDVPATGEDYARARNAIRAHVSALVEQMARSRQ